MQNMVLLLKVKQMCEMFRGYLILSIITSQPVNQVYSNRILYGICIAHLKCFTFKIKIFRNNKKRQQFKGFTRGLNEGEKKVYKVFQIYRKAAVYFCFEN